MFCWQWSSNSVEWWLPEAFVAAAVAAENQQYDIEQPSSLTTPVSASGLLRVGYWKEELGSPHAISLNRKSAVLVLISTLLYSRRHIRPKRHGDPQDAGSSGRGTTCRNIMTSPATNW